MPNMTAVAIINLISCKGMRSLTSSRLPFKTSSAFCFFSWLLQFWSILREAKGGELSAFFLNDKRVRHFLESDSGPTVVNHFQHASATVVNNLKNSALR